MNRVILIKVYDILKLMRPYQWIKNLFCFVGVVFGLHLGNYELVSKSIIVFFAFSSAASAVYVLNDLFDVKEDRQHPKKCLRPIASGKISTKMAIFIYVFLVGLALLLSFAVSYKAAIPIALYIILNIYYSLYGKHIVLLDVFIITVGFLLRIIAGTNGLGIRQSEWVILCTVMLTLFLGFAKRRAELLFCENTQCSPKLKRKVLEHYEPAMLNIFIAITSCGAILSYSLFIVLNNKKIALIYSVIFVIYGIFRYIYILYQRNTGQDIANDLLDDKHILLSVVFWVLTYIGILYL